MSLSKIDKFVEDVKHTEIVDTSQWRPFDLVKIFPEYSHGQRLRKIDRVPGDLPLVTAGQFNNGIAQYVKPNKNNEIFENCVTIDMFGNSFYQEGKFICDDNIYPIKPIKNKFVGLYLASIFNKTINSINFGFKKQIRKKQLENLKIKLPVDGSGEPNWKYMENYMKNLYNKIEVALI